mmetsp:Transcript_151727/g.486822  ORF Transcript_151727/g.486822 Transcript_151727/m.486822 type:complete len:133 (+) Transcript_151727:695-1093(+)
MAAMGSSPASPDSRDPEPRSELLAPGVPKRSPPWSKPPPGGRFGGVESGGISPTEEAAGDSDSTRVADPTTSDGGGRTFAIKPRNPRTDGGKQQQRAPPSSAPPIRRGEVRPTAAGVGPHGPLGEGAPTPNA